MQFVLSIFVFPFIFVPFFFYHILQVALASGSGPHIEIVRQAQLGIDLLNLRTVDAHGLPLQPDGLHLSTPAQVHLGQMMADAFLQFVPSSNPNYNVSPILNEAIRLYNYAFYVNMLPLFSTMYPTFLQQHSFFITIFTHRHKHNYENSISVRIISI